MSEKLQAPRGTFDVLPEDWPARRRVEAVAQRVLEAAGYRRIETPAFEATELFARGVGESTDIVQKEMYTFEDAGGRSLTLRPEGTAPVARAYLEHGMHKLPQPVKLWYLSSFFRQEKPQAGRYRQFWQVGAEAIGSADPAVDAELDRAAAHDPRRARRARACGCGSRASARRRRGSTTARALQDHLRAHEDELSGEVRERIDLNPLRAFDSDHPGTQRVMDVGAAAARPPRRRGRRALRGGQGAPRRRGRRLRHRHDARARHGLLHAHGVRVRIEGARRAVGRRGRRALRRAHRDDRRAADAGQRLGGRASSGSCSPPRAGRSPQPVVDLYVASAKDNAPRGGVRARVRGAARRASPCSRSSRGAR